MFIGVDGSSDVFGTQSAQDYDAVYGNSFVRELYENTRHSNKRYVHGPDLLSLGREVTRIAQEIVSYIQATIDTSDDRIIVMAGHSRGGAVCVNVAQRLQRETWSSGLEIQCLALFDAVGRDMATDTEVIPYNVVRTFHAMRDPRAGSRYIFGNTATIAERDLNRKEFMTTHTGVGGVLLDRLAALPDIRSDQPDISAEDETLGMKQVKVWMWRNVSRVMRISEPIDPSALLSRVSGPQWRRISDEVTEETEIIRVLGVFSQMRTYRQEITLPEARTARGIPTLSRLDIPGQYRPIYGASRSSVSPSGIPREAILNLQALLTEMYGTAPHRVVVEHAEADAIIDAWNRNIVSQTGTMYTDRPLCGFCATSLRRLIPLIGMQQLTVYQLQPETGTIFRAIIMSVT